MHETVYVLETAERGTAELRQKHIGVHRLREENLRGLKVLGRHEFHSHIMGVRARSLCSQALKYLIKIKCRKMLVHFFYLFIIQSEIMYEALPVTPAFLDLHPALKVYMTVKESFHILTGIG